MVQPTKVHYDLEESIDVIINHYGTKPSSLIMALQDIQKHYHYLPREALELVAQKMTLPIAQIYSVATFYKAFSLTPKGKHHICICTGTACHVRQSDMLVDNMVASLGINPRQTTPDGNVSFETVNCVGACAMGPLITIDDVFYGNMTVTKMNNHINRLRGIEIKEEGGKDK
jgi:NADH-quinone oxidoreductase subunit E